MTTRGWREPPLRLVDALDGAASVVRRGPRDLLVLGLVLQALVALPSLVGAVAHTVLPYASFPRMAVDVLIGLLAAFLGVLVHLPIIAATWDHLHGRPVRLRSALEVGLRPRSLLALLAAWLVVGIGFVFCVVPGLVLTVWLGLVPALLVVEDPGLDALSRSMRLVRAPVAGRRINGWRMAAVLTVTGALAWSLTIPSLLPTAFYTGWKGMEAVLSGAPSDQAALASPAAEVLGVLLAVPLRAVASLVGAGWLLGICRLVREEQEAVELVEELRAAAR